MAMGLEQSYVGHMVSMEDMKSEARLPTSASRSLRRAKTVMGTEEDFAEVLAENHDLVEQLRELQLENERLRYEKEREQSDAEFEDDVAMPERIEKHRSSTGVRFALSKTEPIASSSSLLRRRSSIGGDRGRSRIISEDALHSVGRLKSDSISPGSDRSDLEAQLAEVTRQFQELGRANEATRERENALVAELQQTLQREQQASAQVKHLSESLEECHQLLQNLKEQVKKSEEERHMDLSQSRDGGAVGQENSMLRGLERSATSLALELGDDDSDEDSALPSARSRASTGDEKEELRSKLESITSENINLHNQIREHQEAIHLLEKQVAHAGVDAYRGEISSLNEKAVATLKDARVPALHLPHAVETMSTQSSPCPSPRSLEAELESLRKRLAERDQEVAEAKKQLEEQSATLKKNEEQTRQEKSSSDDADQLRKTHEAELESLKNSLLQSNQEVAKLKRDLEELTANTAKARSPEDAHKVKEAQEAELDSHKKLLAERDQEVASLKQQTEHQVTSQAKEADELRQSHQAELESVKKQLLERDHEVLTLKQQLQSSSSEKPQEADSTSETIATLRKTQAELDSIKKNLADREAEVSTLKREIDETKSASKAHTSSDESEKWRAHQEGLEKQLAERDAQVSLLKKQLEELAASTPAPAAPSTAELDNLKKELASRSEEVASLRKQVGDHASNDPKAQTELETLKKQLAERDQEVSNLQKKVQEQSESTAKADVEKLNEQLAQQQQEVRDLTIKLEKQANDSSKTELESLRKHLADRDEEVDHLKKKMEEKTTSNPNDAGSSADHSSQPHDKETSPEEALNNLKMVEAELDTLRSRLVERDQEVSSLKKRGDDQVASGTTGPSASNAQEGQVEKKGEISSEEFERLRRSYIKEVQNRKKLQKQVLEMRYVIQSDRENGGWFNKMFGMMCVSGREAAPVDADDASEKGSASPSDQGRQLKLQGAD